MEDIQAMTEDELLNELDRLEDCLRDVAEEREMFFQTSIHMGRRHIEEMRQEWANDEQRYLERMSVIRTLLSRKDL